jgi:hypothetical protein
MQDFSELQTLAEDYYQAIRPRGIADVTLGQAPIPTQRHEVTFNQAAEGLFAFKWLQGQNSFDKAVKEFGRMRTADNASPLLRRDDAEPQFFVCVASFFIRFLAHKAHAGNRGISKTEARKALTHVKGLLLKKDIIRVSGHKGWFELISELESLEAFLEDSAHAGRKRRESTWGAQRAALKELAESFNRQFQDPLNSVKQHLACLISINNTPPDQKTIDRWMEQ